jgi:ABC-type transport system substrate-binding protein
MAGEPNLAAWMNRTAERAEIDGVPLPPNYPRGEQVAEERLAVVLRGGGGPLQDARVQDALLAAVDWQALVEGSFEGQDVPVVVELAERDVIQDARDSPYDPDRAKELLAESGYSDGFATALYHPPDDVELRGMIKGMFDAWLKVGVRADPAELPAPDALQRMEASIAAGEAVMSLNRR